MSLKLSKPYIATSLDPIGPQGVIAYSKSARNEDVAALIAADPESLDGRSHWVWLRLANDELALATFPQGDTYEDLNDDVARFRGDGQEHRFQGNAIPAGDAVALIHPTNPDIAIAIISGQKEAQHSKWSWIKLDNGDLALGLFQSGELSAEITTDAAWPGMQDPSCENRFEM